MIRIVTGVTVMLAVGFGFVRSAAADCPPNVDDLNNQIAEKQRKKLDWQKMAGENLDTTDKIVKAVEKFFKGWGGGYKAGDGWREYNQKRLESEYAQDQIAQLNKEIQDLQKLIDAALAACLPQDLESFITIRYESGTGGVVIEADGQARLTFVAEDEGGVLTYTLTGNLRTRSFKYYNDSCIPTGNGPLTATPATTMIAISMFKWYVTDPVPWNGADCHANNGQTYPQTFPFPFATFGFAGSGITCTPVISPGAIVARDHIKGTGTLHCVTTDGASGTSTATWDFIPTTATGS